MDDTRFFYRWQDLPFALDEETYGKLVDAVEKAPGVFSLCTERPRSVLAREYYVVTPQAVPFVISPEVADCGTADGEIRIFEYRSPTDPYALVAHEVLRYRVKNGLPLAATSSSLYVSAIYCAEYFPWYFGGTIPPTHTPFGLTIRVKKADEGIFFLETDQCRWVLAVSYPIWDSELSKYTETLGAFCTDDLSTKVPESRYLFIPRERCATAVYELMDNQDHKGLLNFVRSKEAVESHLWKYHAPYAVQHNTREVSGHGGADLFENLLRNLGIPIFEPDEEKDAAMQNQRVKNCIHYAPELAEQDFLLLP